MPSRLFRIFAFTWAVASAAIPGAAAIADAHGEAAAAAPGQAHVEMPGGSDSCPLVHDASCGTCSLLRHGTATAARALAAAPMALVACPAAADPVARAGAPQFGPAIARAPPAA